MTPELFRELVAEAALSPNVHNIQPTQWRRIDGDTIALIASPGRTLPVGDPTGRDAAASHGAAAEGMILAASLRGIALSLTAPAQGEVARLAVTGSTTADPLAARLTRRRTYRGKFDRRRTDDALAALETFSHPDARLITDRAEIEQIARLTDQATMRAFRNRPYRTELTSWMRLTPRHPRWSVDGLNAQAMAMSTPVAVAAGVVMSHPVFEALDAVKLAAPLTGEAATTNTAAALVALVQDRDAPPFETGRLWHRLWLELTARGLAASPLTILGDDPMAADEMAERLSVPSHRRVVTVLRAGMVDAARLPAPARLSVDELIVP
ncbi:hypothetical protein [uncultured Brevundimonas sp.]|uniref:hypothetical protein n=1 Tax=uncultured Brevundimonas sp. TaxID=213418 RepID=UPI0026147B85|nr:hypothetical protein [uncultured Brevundimonas sp.]